MIVLIKWTCYLHFRVTNYFIVNIGKNSDQNVDYYDHHVELEKQWHPVMNNYKIALDCGVASGITYSVIIS